MAYGFHNFNRLIALVMLRYGDLDFRLPQTVNYHTKTTKTSYLVFAVLCMYGNEFTQNKSHSRFLKDNKHDTPSQSEYGNTS